MRLFFKGCMVFFLICIIGLVVLGSPQDEEEIPIFPGAVRDYTAEEEYALQSDGWGEDEMDSFSSESTKVFTVNAVPEEVVEFYISELNAEEGWSEGDSYYEEKPWYELQYYTEIDFEDQYEHDTMIYDGQYFKNCLYNRESWDGEGWIRSALIAWDLFIDNGSTAQFSINIEDDSYDRVNKTFEDRSIVTVHVFVERSEEAVEYEMDQEIDEEMDNLAQELLNNPPTEESLGVPIYPGAVLNVDYSAGMSMDGDFYYVYLTMDSIVEVVSFYEDKLNKTASSGEFGYLIALKGKMPVPDEAISIQDNIMLMEEGKTVITIHKSGN